MNIQTIRKDLRIQKGQMALTHKEQEELLLLEDFFKELDAKYQARRKRMQDLQKKLKGAMVIRNLDEYSEWYVERTYKPFFDGSAMRKALPEVCKPFTYEKEYVSLKRKEGTK